MKLRLDTKVLCSSARRTFETQIKRGSPAPTVFHTLPPSASSKSELLAVRAKVFISGGVNQVDIQM